jgi:hypothetical protein
MPTTTKEPTTMPSEPQPSTPPQGVTFGDPVPTGVTFGEPSQAPQGVTFGEPTTPAPTQPQPLSALDRVGEAIGMPSGFAKGVVRTGAGLLDLANQPIFPGLGEPGQPLVPQIKKATDWIRSKTEAHGVGETIGELMEGGGELAIPGAEEGAVAKASEMYKGLGDLTKVLEKYPTIHAMIKTAIATGKGALRTGAEMGGQTFVKTGGDVEETKKATTTGAVVGGFIGGGGKAISEGFNLLKPGAETLEGVEVPKTAAQQPNAPIVTKAISPAGEIPKIQEAQSQAAAKIIRTGAQRAVQTVLKQVNAARAPIEGPAEEAGIYPGKFKFTVAPHGADVQTTDPNLVQKLLNEARDAQESEGFSELGPRIQTRVNNTVDSLSDQLDQYHKEMTTRPRFLPVDEASAVANTDDYRTAGDIVQNSIDDIYQSMRGAANETLDKKWLKQLTPSEFTQLMEENADRFSPADRQLATDIYRKGVALKSYHDGIQKAWNIGPQQEAAAADLGAKRVFTGQDKVSNAIDDVVSEHGEDLKSMVGDEGIRSVRRLNQLTKDPETSGRFNNLIQFLGRHARRHYGEIGGLIGSIAGHFAGVPPIVSGTVGLATGMATKKVINAVASNPAIADRVAYAVTNNVPLRIAGPLITSMIVKAQEPTHAGSGRDSQQP